MQISNKEIKRIGPELDIFKFLEEAELINIYLYCPYRCVISKFSRCILSNTTR
jgi:hypothetical protein